MTPHPVGDDPILVAREGAIATVTLNRPQKLNALTKAMWRDLGVAVARLGADAELRCIVVRGAGERAFSPGNDIGEFARERSNKAEARAYGAFMHETARTLADCPIPMIAQIHGICVGGGLEIAALCDLRICGASSRFGAPIKNLGLVMAYAEMAPLVRLVGPTVALEVLLEGRIFDAVEAKEKGLVTRVVADDEVASEVAAAAARIAEGAPLVARWHKKFARRLADPTPISEVEADECFDCFDTEDFRIGYAAFLAKQKPQFKGR
ncbi:MAG TPA: enoyl-CoA hydratase-related protein [Casimicrobiaceae bacterium]|jgi:enoyl-CoA hydratase/carnithine racemase|nr:enoyl-CoA hydratase-related protein [Casimicrobiaceae bacterium]